MNFICSCLIIKYDEEMDCLCVTTSQVFVHYSHSNSCHGESCCVYVFSCSHILSYWPQHSPRLMSQTAYMEHFNQIRLIKLSYSLYLFWSSPNSFMPLSFLIYFNFWQSWCMSPVKCAMNHFSYLSCMSIKAASEFAYIITCVHVRG